MWMTLVDLFLWLVIYSVTGWMYESALCSVQERRLVNRGFLNGPLCPVYGFGAVIVLVGVGWLQGHPLWLFLAGMLLTCTVEYLTAWLLETLFDTKWWDYSHMRFHLHGRICLLGALVFGLFSVVLVQWLHPLVRSLTGQVTPLLRLIIAVVLFAAIAADTAVTVTHILRMNGRLREIEEAVDRFTNRTSEQVVEWRNRLAAGVRETAESLLGSSGELTQALARSVHEKVESLMESAGSLRDTAEGLADAAENLLKSAGDLQRNVAEDVRERIAGVRAALAERFTESEFFSERVRGLFDMQRFQSRRLSRAFPRMAHRRYGRAWLELKRDLQAGKAAHGKNRAALDSKEPHPENER